MQQNKQNIISIATTSYRLKYAYLTIEKLLQGTLLPDKIILSVSKEPYLLDDGINYLPDEFRQLGDKVDIRWVPNTGPHRKYIYAFKNYRNDRVILLDDDLNKDVTFLEELVQAHCQYPNCIIASMASDMIPFTANFWMPKLRTSKSLFDESESQSPLWFWCGHGTLFDTSLFCDEEIEYLCDVCTSLRIAPSSSEAWLNAFAIVKGIPVYCLCKGFETLEGSQEKCLMSYHTKKMDVKKTGILLSQNHFRNLL